MDIDVLITLVFEKPPLWDKRHKFHSNRHIVDKCWEEVSLQMKQDEYKIRKKWRYLRDQFAVELGKISPFSGDEASCPKWPHFKTLLFLKDVVTPRVSSGNLIHQRSATPVDLNTETMVGDDYCTPIVSSKNYKDDDDDNDQPTMFPAPSIQNSAKRFKMSYNDKILEIENKRLLLLQEKQKSIQKLQMCKENVLFFKSLLPHVPKIPQHKILYFRNRIQDVVKEFAYRT